MSKHLAKRLAAAGLLTAAVTTLSFASGNYFAGVYKYLEIGSESQAADSVEALAEIAPPLTVPVTKTVCNTGSPTFATMSAAIADANASVPTGGVIYEVCAGFTETAPAGGYSITAAGTLSDQVVFRKDPLTAGANPTFTASSAL